MPKNISPGLIPYFYKTNIPVLSAYQFDMNGDNVMDTFYVCNNEDVGSYTALAIKRDVITSEEGTILNELTIGLDNVDLAFTAAVKAGSFDYKACNIGLLLNASSFVALYSGVCDAPAGDENWVTLTIKPLTQLDREYPKRIYQYGCNWQFGKSPCDYVGTIIDLADYDYEGTLSAESDGNTLTIAHGEAVNYFVPGYAQITSGTYSGEARPIQANGTGDVTLRVGFGHTIPNGTSMKLQKLCDKNPEACINKFNNFARYGGFPNIPSTPII